MHKVPLEAFYMTQLALQLPASTEFKACLKNVCLDWFYLVEPDRRKKAICKCMRISSRIILYSIT